MILKKEIVDAEVVKSSSTETGLKHLMPEHSK